MSSPALSNCILFYTLDKLSRDLSRGLVFVKGVRREVLAAVSPQRAYGYAMSRGFEAEKAFRKMRSVNVFPNYLFLGNRITKH